MKVGDKVERIGSGYQNGQKGEVIEINEDYKQYRDKPATSRARIRWNPESVDGRNLRTWVNFRYLRVLPQVSAGHDCIDIDNNPTGKTCAACVAEATTK